MSKGFSKNTKLKSKNFFFSKIKFKIDSFPHINKGTLNNSKRIKLKKKNYLKVKLKKAYCDRVVKNSLFFFGLKVNFKDNILVKRIRSSISKVFIKSYFFFINILKRRYKFKKKCIFILNYFNIIGGCFFKNHKSTSLFNYYNSYIKSHITFFNNFFFIFTEYFSFLYFINKKLLVQSNFVLYLLSKQLKLKISTEHNFFYKGTNGFLRLQKIKTKLLLSNKTNQKISVKFKKWKNKKKCRLILFYLLVNVKLGLNPRKRLNKYKSTGKLIRYSKLKKRLSFKRLKRVLNLHYKWYLFFIQKYKKKKYFFRKRRLSFKFKKFYHSQLYWKHFKTKILGNFDNINLEKNNFSWKFSEYHEYFFSKIAKFFNLRLFNYNKIALRVFFWKKYNIKLNYLHSFKKHFKINSFYNFFLFFEHRLDIYLVKAGFSSNLNISRMFINCGYVFINFKLCQDIRKVVIQTDFVFLHFKKTLPYIYSIKNQFFLNYTHAYNFQKKKKKNYFVKKTNLYKKLRFFKKYLILLKLSLQFKIKLRFFNYETLSGITSSFYWVKIVLFNFIKILTMRRKLNIFLLNYKIFDVLVHCNI